MRTQRNYQTISESSMAALAMRTTARTGREVRAVYGNSASIELYYGNKCIGAIRMHDNGGRVVVSFANINGSQHVYTHRDCVVCGKVAECGDYCRKCSENIPF